MTAGHKKHLQKNNNLTLGGKTGCTRDYILTFKRILNRMEVSGRWFNERIMETFSGTETIYLQKGISAIFNK